MQVEAERRAASARGRGRLGGGRSGRGGRRRRDGLLRLEGRHRQLEPRDRRAATRSACSCSRTTATAPSCAIDGVPVGRLLDAPRPGGPRPRRQLHRGRRHRRAARLRAAHAHRAPRRPRTGADRLGGPPRQRRDLRRVLDHGARARATSRAPPALADAELNPLFLATVDATEEAVVNASGRPRRRPAATAAGRAAPARAGARAARAASRPASGPEHRRPSPARFGPSSRGSRCALPSNRIVTCGGPEPRRRAPVPKRNSQLRFSRASHAARGPVADHHAHRAPCRGTPAARTRRAASSRSPVAISRRPWMNAPALKKRARAQPERAAGHQRVVGDHRVHAGAPRGAHVRGRVERERRHVEAQAVRAADVVGASPATRAR